MRNLALHPRRFIPSLHRSPAISAILHALPRFSYLNPIVLLSSPLLAQR